ncbi:uncharacterized protein [Euphorbia lathyris]|uniref:uncharacterized protein isoform X2 n=1 Tax=Euphorbia lathyris TaxID=212925 RepID=UPI0033133A64
MKTRADKHRRDVQFSMGDWVYIKLKPHRQQSVARRVYPKLSARFYGPYPVTARIGSVAYRLQLSDTSRIHPVFRVSLLKKAIGAHSASTDLPQELAIDPSDTLTPAKVLATRTTQKHGDSVSQWLIQWQSKGVEDATWEDEFVIKSEFPSFCLEDKTLSQGGGNDREQDISRAILQPDHGPKPLQIIPFVSYFLISV